MSWVKMDDQWPFNRKLRLVEPTDRLMWVMAIPYCSGQTTDGRLDGPMLEMVAFLAGASKPYEAADRLVAAGLFDLDAGGWKVHDYLEFQPSSEQRAHISEERKRAGQVGGKKSGESRRKPSANGKQVASPPLQHFGTPSRPVPSSPVPSDDDSLSLAVLSPKTAFGSGTDRSTDHGTDHRITATFDAWLNSQAEVRGIPEGKRREGYIQQSKLTIDQHWPALKQLVQANPTATPTELAAMYRKPKP